MVLNGVYYPFYPKIRESDIGVDTSNRFVDTFQMSNNYLAGMGADFDGDTITTKGVYTEEANEEIENFTNSIGNFISFGGQPSKTPGTDVIQSLYALTKILSDASVTKDIKFA